MGGTADQQPQVREGWLWGVETALDWQPQLQGQVVTTTDWQSKLQGTITWTQDVRNKLKMLLP